MWPLILLAGAAGVGIYLLTRSKETKQPSSESDLETPPSASPPVTEPDQSMLVPLAQALGAQQGVTYFVQWFAWSPNTPPGFGISQMMTYDQAYAYYQALRLFFSENHQNWTCDGGVCTLELADFSFYKDYPTGSVHQVLQSKQYTQCGDYAAGIGVPSVDLTSLTPPLLTPLQPVIALVQIRPDVSPVTSLWAFQSETQAASYFDAAEEAMEYGYAALPVGAYWVLALLSSTPRAVVFNQQGKVA